MNECDDCGTMNRPSAAFCSGCGTDLGADAEFAAEEGFSVKWLVLGVLIMFGTNIGLGFLLGIVLAATGTKVSIVFTGLCGMVAFALGGYITGKQSPGKTILEPAVAALIAVVLSAILQEIGRASCRERV